MNFHGMNYHCKKVGTPYLYREDICIILEFFKTKEYSLCPVFIVAGKLCSTHKTLFLSDSPFGTEEYVYRLLVHVLDKYLILFALGC
jgi:hypothetical protein